MGLETFWGTFWEGSRIKDPTRKSFSDFFQKGLAFLKGLWYDIEVVRGDRESKKKQE